MRALYGGRFQHGCADALARHFEQAEMADAAHLDAGAIVLQALLELALDRPIVPVLLHVDEVDHDEAGKVAQAQLAGPSPRSLHIGAQGSVLDVVLARGAARVHIDRDERFGLVEHDVAARFQVHDIREHLIELPLDAEAAKSGWGSR